MKAAEIAALVRDARKNVDLVRGTASIHLNGGIEAEIEESGFLRIRGGGLLHPDQARKLANWLKEMFDGN